jgi:diaminopimelate epimerase
VPVAVEAEPPVRDLPLDVDGRTLTVTCVSMGNPHAVHFIEEPVASFPLEALGPLVSNHELFPNGVNFEVARMLARDRIEARVWERGAGPTLACGTGACATVVAARLAGLVDDWVVVRLPGGELTIEWDGAGDVMLEGPAVEVYSGELGAGNQ